MKRKMITIFALLLITVLSIAGPVQSVYAGVGIDAESKPYKIGKKVKGITKSNHSYYKFKLDKRTGISIDWSSESSNPYDGQVMYMWVMNGRGQTVIPYGEFEVSYNKINGRYSAHAAEALNKGTYYIEIAPWLSTTTNYHYNFTVKKIPVMQAVGN